MAGSIITILLKFYWAHDMSPGGYPRFRTLVITLKTYQAYVVSQDPSDIPKMPVTEKKIKEFHTLKNAVPKMLTSA